MGAGRVPPLSISRFLATLAVAATCHAHAAPAQLVIHATPVAGLAYHEAASVWPQLKTGDALELEHERDNPHDARAVRVSWHGHVLGYLPAAANAPVAAALDRHQAVSARVSALRDHPNPRERLRIELLVPLASD